MFLSIFHENVVTMQSRMITLFVSFAFALSITVELSLKLLFCFGSPFFSISDWTFMTPYGIAHTVNGVEAGSAISGT